MQGRTRDGEGRGWLARSCKLAAWLFIVGGVIFPGTDVLMAQVAPAAIPSFQAYPWAAYEVQFSGNARDATGATVHLSSKGDEVKPFGSATTNIDGTPFRNHRLRLSADLATHDAIDGAAVWLRADAAGKSRAFMNSEAEPVNDRTGSGRRQVEIDVPGDVDRIAFGVLLMKHGQLTATRLSLEDLGEEQSSPFAGPTLDAAIDIVRKNAYHSRDVDWSSVESEVREFAGKTGKLSETHAAIKVLLKALNDHHRVLMDANRAAAYSHNGQAPGAARVEARGVDLGYISMPSFMGTDPKLAADFAASLSKAIVDLSPRCGWVLDLRKDSGGNMHPMLAALRPLLGASPVGSFEQADGRITPFPVMGSTTVDQSAVPVAVLTGPHTASSGEAVAVALKGRSNTRSFGSGTAGLSSGNELFPLPDGSVIALMVSIDRDRDGHRYGGAIEPDEAVDDMSAEADAAAWLREKCQAASQSGAK